MAPATASAAATYSTNPAIQAAIVAALQAHGTTKGGRR